MCSCSLSVFSVFLLFPRSVLDFEKNDDNDHCRGGLFPMPSLEILDIIGSSLPRNELGEEARWRAHAAQTTRSSLVRLHAVLQTTTSPPVLMHKYGLHSVLEKDINLFELTYLPRTVITLHHEHHKSLVNNVGAPAGRASGNLSFLTHLTLFFSQRNTKIQNCSTTVYCGRDSHLERTSSTWRAGGQLIPGERVSLSEAAIPNPIETDESRANERRHSALSVRESYLLAPASSEALAFRRLRIPHSKVC